MAGKPDHRADTEIPNKSTIGAFSIQFNFVHFLASFINVKILKISS